MSGHKEHNVPFVSIVPFLLIAFGLTWGILSLFIFLTGTMTKLVGELTGQHPLFFLAVYAPAIAGFITVTWYGGREGLRRFGSRFLLWRCSRIWYAFLLIGVPLIFYLGAALKGTLFEAPLPFHSLQSLCLACLFAAVKGPVEEFGWRGLALPLLQRKLAPFWAGLVLGGIWGFWHLPAFLLSGTQQSEWSFAPFFVGCIALSVVVTALFHASQGSILLSAFFHFLVMNPIFPDAAPYDTYLFAGAAAMVSWFNRESMFTKEGAVVQVIPNQGTG